MGFWISFPISVRAAQKIARKRNEENFFDWERLSEAVKVSPFNRQALIRRLDQLAQTKGPDFLIDLCQEEDKSDEGTEQSVPSDQSDSPNKSNLSIKEEERGAGANSFSLASEDDGANPSDQSDSSNLSDKEEEKGAGANPPSAAPEEGGIESPGLKEGSKSGDQGEGDSAQTDSRQEESQSQPETCGGLGRDTSGAGESPEAGDTPSSNRPETGNSTSGEQDCGETAQSSHPPAGEPLSTALREKNGRRPFSFDVPRNSRGLFRQEDCPRDGVFFQRLPGEEQPEESPPQKKMGNTAEGKPSDQSSDRFGSVTAEMKRARVDAGLVRQCRQRLSRLVGDSSEDFGPRRDLPDFCVRLKTYQKLPPARREERGRPAILVLADVSISCSGFSQKAVAVAKAAGAVGVPGADVVSVTHSNGHPSEVLHNQSFILPDTIGPLPAEEDEYGLQQWYGALQKRFSFQVVIALGDWHAVFVYAYFLLDPEVQKVIWMNNAFSVSRGFIKDETAMAVKEIPETVPELTSGMVRQKLSYFDGCKEAKDFIELIK